MKLIFVILSVFAFSGCNLLETQEEKGKRLTLERLAFEKKVSIEKDIQLQRLSSQTQREIALLESKKVLALIEKDKEIELKKLSNITQKEELELKAKREILLLDKNQELAKIKMQAEVEKQKIVFAQNEKSLIFEQKLEEIDQSNNMELKRYIVVIFAVVLLIASFFTFYYFKKRREDKLLAYNDNLKKYFYQKENDARVEIASKILDTISSGNLNKEQENQLISVFSGDSKVKPQQIEFIDVIQEK